METVVKDSRHGITSLLYWRVKVETSFWQLQPEGDVSDCRVELKTDDSDTENNYEMRLCIQGSH